MGSTFVEVIEKIVVPLLREAVIPAVLLYLGVRVKREFQNARQLQAEHFAHDKRIKIYESLAEKVIKTKNSIYRSVITLQGVIGIIGEYCDSDKKEGKSRDFSFITQVSQKMEELHKEMNDNVEDLINTFRAYSITFHPNFKLAQAIEEKLSEIRSLYMDNYGNILALKCAVESKVSLLNFMKDIIYLLDKVSPQYKIKCDDLTRLVGEFCDEAQTALLGPLFNSSPAPS